MGEISSTSTSFQSKIRDQWLAHQAARDQSALIILFTDLASQDTKGEIVGVTAAINAFAFGMISFLGGGMQTFDESVPLIASSLLMTVSWIVLQTRKPKTAPQEIGSRLRAEVNLQIAEVPLPTIESNQSKPWLSDRPYAGIEFRSEVAYKGSSGSAAAWKGKIQGDALCGSMGLVPEMRSRVINRGFTPPDIEACKMLAIGASED
jgi:hypothetical protein